MTSYEKKKTGIFSSKKILTVLTCAILAVGIMGCDDHGGGATDDGLVGVSGQAFYPLEVSTARVAVANTSYQILDLEKSFATQTVADDFTDANGNFSVVITQSKLVVVIVSGVVRVSGLIVADPGAAKDGDVGKTLDGVTDVACEAGVTAITDGSLEADDFDNERVANLEAGAALVEATNSVNFYDPASVTAAAALVRQITDDGDHLPQ